MGKAMNGKDGSDIDQLNPCVRWFDPYFSWSHLHTFCWFFFPQPQWDGINAVVQVQRFAQKYQIMIGSYPIGSMVLLYMVTFTIIIPQMLAYTIHGSYGYCHADTRARVGACKSSGSSPLRGNIGQPNG